MENSSHNHKNDPQRYLASLPERTVRAGAALVGGLLNETSNLLLPRELRHSRLYQATVAQLMRITVEMVGDVQGVFPGETIPVQELFIRKSAGNVIEVAGFLAVGWSPVWLLAAASDLIGGTRTYLRALVVELKQAGVLPEDANISSFDELLTVLEGTSGTLGDTIVVLPLTARDMRTSWQTLQQHVNELPDARQLASIFAVLQQAAQQEGRSLLEMSSIVGLGAVRAGIQMGNTYLFDYYRDALHLIAEEGLLAYLRRVSTPYLTRAVRHFDPHAATLTDQFLSRWVIRRPVDAPPPQLPADEIIIVDDQP